MFRSGPPRRPPARRRVGPAEGPMKMLRLAHRLMERGQHAQAYPLFRKLADGAARRGMPIRAANLYVQAGRARLEMGSAKDAAELARRAIHLLRGAGQVERVRALLPRMIAALENKGYRDEAVALRAEITALLGPADPTPTASQRGNLPIRCPSCSGPVHPDQVTWVDDASAECAYCGSMIRTE